MEKVMKASLTNPLSQWAAVINLAWLILRWELHLIDRNLREHPYSLDAELIDSCVDNYSNWLPVEYASASSQGAEERATAASMEVQHQELFQALWTQFDDSEYLDRVNRYVRRLKSNDRGTSFWAEKSVLDLGCGHGNFAIAISKFQPKQVTGVDFGEASVSYAKDAASALKVTNVAFEVQNVHAVTFPDETFDVVIQNGVFHHLEEEDTAYCEAVRVLRKGGYFWIYTDGQDHIFGDIQHAAARILSDVSHGRVIEILANMGLSRGKQYHLGDSLKATYRHRSFEELESYLASFGLKLLRRLEGGYETDFDAEVIKKRYLGRREVWFRRSTCSLCKSVAEMQFGTYDPMEVVSRYEAIFFEPDKTKESLKFAYQLFEEYASNQLLTEFSNAETDASKSLIDLGCATGEFLAYARYRSIKVHLVGVDASQWFIDIAKQKFDSDDRTNFICADITKVSNIFETFDGLFLPRHFRSV